MKRRYEHVLAAFYGAPWAILPEKFRELEAVLWRRIDSGPLVLNTPQLTREAREQVRAEWEKFSAGNPNRSILAFDDGDFGPQDRGPGYKLVGSAAVIPIHGTITPHVSMFSDWSGGASAEGIGNAVDAALADPKVNAIVLDIDSPGGSLFGVPESAQKVLAARKVKPVHAVANHVAASAAYWIAAQATEVTTSSAGWVGSVGVIWPRIDDSKAEELAGIKTTYFHAGENKTDGHGPITEGEAERRQAMVNTAYAQFVSALAKGRGVTTNKVEKDFGKGAVKLPADAIDSKMADRVATLEQVVNGINETRTKRTQRQVAADLAAAGLPTA